MSRRLVLLAEIEKEKAQIVGGSVPVRLAQYRKEAPFVILNYELALRDLRCISELRPDLLILDEAQRIKNWRAQTARAVKDIQTRFAFVLSGTPLQNRLDDLYSIMQVVDQRVLGPLWMFNERYIERELGKSRILGYQSLGELRKRLSPCLLRREKEDVSLQLPERIDSRRAVALTEIQKELMEEAMAKAARLMSISERRPLTLEEEQRLFMAMQSARMACNAAGLVDKETEGSPKLDELQELIRELCLERGRKTVVFSEWETFGRMAAQRAEALGIGFVRLHGGVPAHKRGDLIAKFRDDPDCKLFFSTDAGGVGLNLQFASTVINLDVPWNPAVLDQRIGRVHRHGQREPVHVVMVVSEGSFEHGLEMVLAKKRALFSAAMTAALRTMGLSEDLDTAELPPPRLLYEILVPQGKLTLEQAAQISRAEGLAQAYSQSTVAVPSALLSMVLSDAESLLSRLAQV